MDTTDSPMHMHPQAPLLANSPFFQNCYDHHQFVVPAINNGENHGKACWGMQQNNVPTTSGSDVGVAGVDGASVSSSGGSSHVAIHSHAVVEQPATFVTAAGSFGATQLTPSLVDSLASAQHHFHVQQVIDS
jgi:hypothetical protein